MIKFLLPLLLLCGSADAAQIFYDPRDYGATFDGQDDAPAWQAAINAAVAAGGQVLAPCGNSYIDKTLVVASPLVLQGSGMQCTTVVTRTTGPAILVTMPQAAAIRDLTVQCTQDGQIGIRVTAAASLPGTGNSGSEIGRVRISTCAIGIDFANAMTWSLHDGVIQAGGKPNVVGIQLSNEVTDAGDSTIYAMVIVDAKPAPAGSVAIRHLQSGGLKITSSKILGWAFGYQLSQQGGQMSDLAISNSSFESITGPAIGFARTAGVFHNVVINGDQFASTGSCVKQITAGTWLGDVIVTSNRCSDGIVFFGAERVTTGLNN